MDLTVQNVYGLLLRSKLLSIDDCKAMFARWQEEAKDGATNLAKFAAWMVAQRYVTEYQATLLARGHADGFFISEYKVLDRLGKGRMAGVYKAQHGLGQVVAIKVLPPSRALEPMMLGRFQRESKLALRLKHANIVRAFQIGSSQGLHYLVMEHLEGETLEDVLLRRKQLPVDEAVRLIYQALQGLQHIHEQGLVHRDLKPANLMLVPTPTETTRNCTMKILDLGLGRVLSEGGLEAQDAGLTGEGVLLGTPDYMAPEQARDPRASDIRADIYSLGCVLYHLLTGQPPFPDTNIISQMIRHATEPIRPLREHNPTVPDGLQQILNWMMAKDPTGRYQTPERGAQALEMFLAAGATPASNPDLDPNMQSYLRWLETDARMLPGVVAMPPTMPMVTLPSPPGSPRPSSSAIPLAAVVSPGVTSERKKRPASGSKDPVLSTSEGKRKKGVSPPNLPVAELVVESVEVELVAMPPKGARGRGELTRRDFILFFAGVVSGLIAYAIGRAFASLLGR